jgi:hypothetical protein
MIIVTASDAAAEQAEKRKNIMSMILIQLWIPLRPGSRNNGIEGNIRASCLFAKMSGVGQTFLNSYTASPFKTIIAVADRQAFELFYATDTPID